MSLRLIDRLKTYLRPLNELRPSRNLYEETLPTVKEIFYRVFRDSKYKVSDSESVAGMHFAQTKSDKGYVHVTTWDWSRNRPRISVSGISDEDEVKEDARRLADEIEKKTKGYVSWECNFDR